MKTSKIKKILKPWGHELWFAVEPEYVGKILFIKKGHRYSLQYHEEKKETQYLLKGKIRFTIGKELKHLNEVILNPGDRLTIHPKIIHRAYGLKDSELLEISTSHLEDVIKLADDYGRTGKGNDFRQDARLARTRK